MNLISISFPTLAWADPSQSDRNEQTDVVHTYNYDYERVSINGHQIVYNNDGSWTLVISAQDPGHPNWIRTQGHKSGVLWARWSLPEETPGRSTTRVVRLSDVAKVT